MPPNGRGDFLPEIGIQKIAVKNIQVFKDISGSNFISARLLTP
jgi:hypothetical protein